MSIEVEVLQTQQLAFAAFDVAVESRISVYDACYVELANRLNIPLVTADRELFTRTAPELPVLWIGAMQ